jgi:hypothetical protein
MIDKMNNKALRKVRTFCFAQKFAGRCELVRNFLVSANICKETGTFLVCANIYKRRELFWFAQTFNWTREPIHVAQIFLCIKICLYHDYVLHNNNN